MPEAIGRYDAKRLLDKAYRESKPSLVAVYGRRRIGKTFLIKTHMDACISFQYSGIHNVSNEIQLEKFTEALGKQLNKGKPVPASSDWFAAFNLLAALLGKKRRNKKSVVFLDEFPWMQTPKSNFLAAFENFWNSYAANNPGIMVILCGSAASWMIQNVVRNKGGLHNRITHKIALQPFSLHETGLFLKSRKVQLSYYQTMQLYMAFGGIPMYLEQVEPGRSTAQIIDAACFSKNGFLYNEFSDLYHALFYESDRHIKIIRALATKPMGLTRNALIKTAKLQSGGTVSALLEELSAGGFISQYIPFGKKTKDAIYKLTDEFSLFYIKFMEPNRSGGRGTWLRLSDTPAYKSWSGFAFETLCIKHIEAMKKALGIHGIYTETSAWKSTHASGGAQIDLVIDRRDQCINLCEMKFYGDTFSIDKKYAAALRHKASLFKQHTKTRKQIFWVIAAPFGLHKNEHSIGLADAAIDAEDLFVKLEL